MSKALNINEYELAADVCRESFFEFVKEFWTEIIPETPVWNWHIPYLCNQMQKIAERVFQGLPKRYDLLVNIPPGTTKSTIISVMFPAWVLTRMPTARIIVATHTDKLGLDLSRKSRDLVKSERYTKCFPNINLREDQDTKGYWAVKKGGFRLSCTVGGQNPMGFHAHFLIVDDPIDPQKVLSEIELASANSFFHETLPSRKVDQRISVTILVMQRLHQDDPTGNWLAHREETIKHICLPAEDSYPVKPPELKNYYVHGLLDPIRLSRFVLAEKESKGQFYYAGQYGQHPVPLGGGMFKTDCLVFDHPPDKFKRTIRYWDNASTKGAGAYSVGAKLAEDYNGRFWVLDIVRGRWATEVRERIKYQTAQIDGYGVIIGQEQEPGSGGKESAEATVKRLAGFRIRLNRPTGEKALRADPFSQQVNVGNVYLPIGKPWIRDYIEEMRFFPMSKYKDQIDASSGAFAELVRQRIVVGAVV